MTQVDTSFLIWSVHDEVPAHEGGIVDQGLGASNAAAAPLDRVEPLSCFARIPSGRVIGGAVGRTWGECCELQQLWVDAEYRQRRIATRLVGLFEERAHERGCRVFYLETFSFQSPALYEGMGYSRVAELRGFPAGIAKYVMVKRTGREAGGGL